MAHSHVLREDTGWQSVCCMLEKAVAVADDWCSSYTNQISFQFTTTQNFISKVAAGHKRRRQSCKEVNEGQETTKRTK